MFKNLSAPAVGIRNLSLQDTIELARRHGFEGVEFNVVEANDLAEKHGSDHVVGMFARANVLPGHWGLPTPWRNDDWREGLKPLEAYAELGRDLGCTRVSAVVMPWSDTRPRDENFAFHVERLGACARVLGEFGCRLGLEFIGPKTLRAGKAHEFVYTLPEMMELAGAIGSNVGLLLDAWHLYTSHGTLADLDTIEAKDVVVVHVNDAPKGVPIDEQIDNVRALPLETGVMDLAGFMKKLSAMGYDGPITVEPFSKRLNDLAQTDPDAVAAEVKRSLDALWSVAGLG